MKPKYVIENGNNMFPVYQTKVGYVLIINDVIDAVAGLKIMGTEDGVNWKVVKAVDILEVLTDLLP